MAKTGTIQTPRLAICTLSTTRLHPTKITIGFVAPAMEGTEADGCQSDAKRRYVPTVHYIGEPRTELGLAGSLTRQQGLRGTA